MKEKDHYVVDVRIDSIDMFTNKGLLAYRVRPSQFKWNIFRRVWFALCGYDYITYYSGDPINIIKDPHAVSDESNYSYVYVSHDQLSSLRTVKDINDLVYSLSNPF